MDGTTVLTIIEALLILLALLISKANRFISPSLYGDQLVVVDDSTKDDVILTQTAFPSSSHNVVSPPATKYDVFLSFRGEDTRHTFASYLCKGLCNAGIHTFMDYELRKGEHISEVLLRTIEESGISIIIFSENYASSTWCLDELVHILKCKEKFGRVVIPIFYNIDPSNIRKQNKSFGKRFGELKRRFENNPGKLQKWINALVKASNLSGWDSKNASSAEPEFKLIEKIVKDILSKLNSKSSCHLEGLVGIARHIRNIENLLDEARIVGIWGMGGAGKTTLANAIFQELRGQFDAFSFIDVNKQLGRISLDELKQKFLQELLKDNDIRIYDIESTFVEKRLGRRKVLLILDDVVNSRIANDLTKWIGWSRKESRIIITSRDIHVLANASASSTYHVPDLNFRDAIRLFSLKAFKQHEPSKGYMDLSISVVKYCQGNPLALVVLGCSLYGREKEEWESALEKLDKDPPKDIVDVLKLSFDGLEDKQQMMFLDLAFLINERVHNSLNLIRQLYDSSLIEIRVLEEKSLISCNNHCLMHDLVKEMGLKIARNQLNSDAKTPIRLWRLEDITDFFTRGKRIETIRCMSLDVSMMKSMTLKASIFRKIRNLMFLKIYKSDWRKPSILNIRGVLDYLSEELRILSWEEYPLPYVPLQSCAENLITLKMRNSNIRQLGEGNLHFPNLEEIDLSGSEHLTALMDLSHTPKIQELNLNSCVNLTQIHSSTFPGKVVHIGIDDCWPMQRKLGGSIKGKNSRLVTKIGINDCWPMQIKLGGSIKGRNSGLVTMSIYLNLLNLSFDKVTMKVFVCGNMICGVRFKHEVMPLEEIEELRKAALSLGPLLPFVREVEWFEDPIEFGHDFNQYYRYSCDNHDVMGTGFHDVDKEESVDGGEMMNGYQAVKMSLMEDDKEEEDDVLMEDWCSKSVTFTRVPNSITRWSLLTDLTLTLKSLPLSNEYYCRRFKPRLDVTLSFPDINPHFLGLDIQYDLGVFQKPGFIHVLSKFFFCRLESWRLDSIYGTSMYCSGGGLIAKIKRKPG